MKKRLISLVTIMLFSSLILLNSTNVFAKQTTPKLSAKKITLNVGVKKALKVKKIKKGTRILWKSGNSKVAAVSKKGVVLARKAGKTTIKATVKQNGKKMVLKCKVTVMPKVTYGSKKNTLFDAVLMKGVAKVDYWVNDRNYIVDNQKRISAFITYMASLEVESTENPKVMGGLSIKVIPKDGSQAITVGLLGDIFNIDGKYYKIKASNIDVTAMAKSILQN